MFLAPDGSEIEIADTAAKFLSRAIPLDRLHGTGASHALSAGEGPVPWSRSSGIARDRNLAAVSAISISEPSGARNMM